LPLRVTRMKYFAVENKYRLQSDVALNQLGYEHIKSYQLRFAVLYENILTDEEYAFFRLKFTTINPTRAQLDTAIQLDKISLNLDEYPA
jgi:hypothetical protein